MDFVGYAMQVYDAGHIVWENQGPTSRFPVVVKDRAGLGLADEHGSAVWCDPRWLA